MLAVTLFLSISTLIFINFDTVTNKKDSIKPLKGLSNFQLSDTLVDDNDLQTYLRRKDSLSKMKFFYQSLESISKEKYIYIFNQPVEVLSQNNNLNKMVYGYEEGWKEFQEKLDNKYYLLKAVQINQQAFNNFPIQLNSGVPFSTSDFINSENTIPILLGSQYNSIYKLNDIIRVKYIDKDFLFIVKGFLKPNTVVSTTNKPELFLDRYIIMPAQQFSNPLNQEDTVFQKRHYLQLINGSVYSNDFNTAYTKIEDIKAKAKFPYTTILRENKTFYNSYIQYINRNIHNLYLLATIFLIGCILIFIITMKNKIRDKYIEIAIHLISGATIRTITMYILFEVGIILAIPTSIVISIYAFFIYKNLLLYCFVILFCSLIMYLLIIIPIMYELRRIKFNNLFIRR